MGNAGTEITLKNVADAGNVRRGIRSNFLYYMQGKEKPF
jgi:hypothetical protein